MSEMITDQAGLDDFLNGVEPTGIGANEGNPPPEEAEPPAVEAPPAEDDPGVTEQKPAAQTKQEYAFAQMRQQNAQLSQQTNQLTQLITKLASANGIEFKDQTELIAKLNDDALTKIAQKQGIPKEFLQRMEQLEVNDKAHQAEQLKSAAFIGFQNLKNEFALNDEELQAFAVELDTKGKNPFIQKVDLTELYTAWHFKEILAKQTQAAVEAALKKDRAADQHSSTPSSATGKSGSGEEKISTVAGLTKFLDGAK